MTNIQQLPPIHHHLGGHDLNWDSELNILKVQYQAIELFCNPRGHIEGGMICAMLDDVMGLLANHYNVSQKPASTINLSMSFFRPCHVGAVQCHARFIKDGRSILHIESEAWQHAKVIAQSQAAFILL